MHSPAISAFGAWRFTLAAVFAGQRAAPFPAFAVWLIAVPVEFFAGYHTDRCAVIVKVKGIFIYIFPKIAFVQVYKSLDIFGQAVTVHCVRIVGGVQQELSDAVFRQPSLLVKKECRKENMSCRDARSSSGNTGRSLSESAATYMYRW